MNTEKLNQAINNGRSNANPSEKRQPENTSTRESGGNLLENAAKIFAAKLQEPFNNALLSELGVGFQNYMEDLAAKTTPAQQNTDSNPVIDVFCKTHTEAYSNGNFRLVSSTSVSTSLPAATTISNGQPTNGNNGNGKEFEPKN